MPLFSLLSLFPHLRSVGAAKRDRELDVHASAIEMEEEQEESNTGSSSKSPTNTFDYMKKVFPPSSPPPDSARDPQTRNTVHLGSSLDPLVFHPVLLRNSDDSALSMRHSTALLPSATADGVPKLRRRARDDSYLGTDLLLWTLCRPFILVSVCIICLSSMVAFRFAQNVDRLQRICGISEEI